MAPEHPLSKSQSTCLVTSGTCTQKDNMALRSTWALCQSAWCLEVPQLSGSWPQATVWSREKCCHPAASPCKCSAQKRVQRIWIPASPRAPQSPGCKGLGVGSDMEAKLGQAKPGEQARGETGLWQGGMGRALGLPSLLLWSEICLLYGFWETGTQLHTHRIMGRACCTRRSFRTCGLPRGFQPCVICSPSSSPRPKARHTELGETRVNE